MMLDCWEQISDERSPSMLLLETILTEPFFFQRRIGTYLQGWLSGASAPLVNSKVKTK